MRRLIFIFIIFLSAFISKGQTITKWDTITRINDIVVDENDNVWVAWLGDIYGNSNIKGCLSKFDGTNWTNYRTANGEELDYITALAVDNNNSLWFANGYGVSTIIGMLDESGFTIYSLPLNQGSIRSINIDDMGNKWFVADGGNGLIKFDNTNWINIISNQSFNSIQFDNNGVAWIGAFDKFTKYDGALIENFTRDFSGIWRRFGYESGPTTYVCAIDNENRKWIGTYYFGIGIFNDTSGVSLRTDNLAIDTHSENSAYKVVIDQNNIKWIGGNDEQFKSLFCKYENNIFSRIDSINLDGYIKSVAIDSKGNKWVGSAHDYGLIRYSDGGAGPLKKKIVRGTVFLDENENGIKDSTEQGIGNQFINFNGKTTITDGNGRWGCQSASNAGTVSYQAQPNWQATTNTSFNFALNNTTQTDTSFIIGVKPLQNINDVKVSLVGGATRALFNAYTWINYKNMGSVVQSGLVSYQYDNLASYVSSIPLADSVSNNTLFWKYDTLAPFEERQISVNLLMPDVTHLGDTLTSYANITCNTSDINLLNNADTINQILTGSYDPNEKLVSPMGITDNNYVPLGTELTYTIHFQNTGTDTAFTVNVRDTISTHMNMNSFELLASSHPVQLDLKAGNILTFKFEHINLPDSAHNQLGSNGYVKYRIKPKANLPQYTMVTNTAYIYFDYNPPIVTNTTLTNYLDVLNFPTGVDRNTTVAAVPNPMNGDITWLVFENPNNNTYTLQICNLQGKIIERIENIKGGQYQFKRGSLQQGLYILNLLPEGKGDVKVGKLVVN